VTAAKATLRKDPVLLFFALGGLLFVTFSLFNRDAPDAIVLSDRGLAVLVSEFEMLRGRPASDAEEASIIRDYYQRELLFREAIAEGLHRSVPGVRQLLIEEMQQRVTGDLPEPSGKDLVNYYTDHMERYYAEATITLEQRFYRDLPGEAEALLAALRSGSAPAGDVTRQGNRFPAYGESMLRGMFGAELFANIQALPTGQWEGPFQSPQGWHFFRVSERGERELLPFTRVRDQVLADYQASTVAQSVSAYVERRRASYPLRREP